ncbi:MULTISPECIES: 50S ribosomal protein L14e [Methanobacterium]|jgi:large subunit ribosomal protein L14e|uniref:50S ribosomal protein L14e n=1 Tax=Methanobacterium subterraneum TaxID=59277 RepID=A0A2H4VDB4_9EURY|nr:MULTISPECIES: 50S ribosomal protein L14e [Methanobacterium]MBW4257755.1 50S ribosomal protein L14e [Methanobacterium sp. YSL]PKL73288.1 MAG: 50S ribosomal protein L14e [Methanobacteriales archaeon HGW-Methanobacteriales-2]AUB56077.1 50S ribosomal protein L14e [Methanobacterium subterraneum]AUB56892.1 50S ribosomal protein L14e [Methanobacterium sp. MZ-A1]AUB60048.1 50S ribosomal protein L14e [Methanobacterium subterraneum]
MPAIEVGRICMKISGREAGEKCVIVEIIDDKFVEVIGNTVKNRRCNIKHLEPLEQVIEIKTEDPEEIKKEFEAAIA